MCVCAKKSGGGKREIERKKEIEGKGKFKVSERGKKGKYKGMESIREKEKMEGFESEEVRGRENERM